MADISVDNMFGQAFEQAGYAASGLTRGAKEVLVSHVEELARQHGLGETFNIARTFISDKYGVTLEADDTPADNSNPAHRCMKESGASAMSAIIGGAANSLEYLERVKSGEMSGKDALVKLVGETVASAADSALKAAGTTGRQSIIEKYGSEENAAKALAEQGVQLLMEKMPLPQGGRQVIDNLIQLVDLGTGKISIDELIRKPGSLIMQSAMGIKAISGVAGKGAVDVVRSQFPKLMKIMPKHPAILAASVVAVIASGIAIKNGIEKPFQDLARNTASLKAATAELDRVSRGMFKGQILFGKYLEADAQMEKQFQERLDSIDKSGKAALDAILKI